MSGDRISLGRIVRSAAGRDQGRSYLVIGIAAPPYVLVADGRTRGADKPKKKNIRHLSVLGYIEDGVAAKLADGVRVTDLEIRAALNAAAGIESSDADEEGCVCPNRTS